MTKAHIRAKAARAIRHFWRVRASQKRRQGQAAGKKDAGNRAAVAGGAQLDGFIKALTEFVAEAGVPESCIHCMARKTTYLPGFYRPTKSWDLVVVTAAGLLACVELKSQVGSFGNNFNNRTEECIGSAHDFWTAYRDGAFNASPRPWLGYFMLLEKAPGSTSPVKLNEPHFRAFDEFREASYARRYELLCVKLLRERLYDGACLIVSDRKRGIKGEYDEPNREVGFTSFAASLIAHASAYANLGE